jgi:hypothetical protein
MTWLHAVIDAPSDPHLALADYWSRVLGWSLGGPWPDHPELRSFEPPRGAPYVHLQEIDGPPRVHVDIESDDADGMVARAVRLGASLVRVTERWRTLTSPGGLPFCVLTADRHEPPEPVTWLDGHRSRLVQVCIDAPPGAHEQEVEFWRSVLPGRWVDSSAPEFAGKWHDAGSPLQLLLQRLDEPSGPVRAHLDLGTDDLPAEVRRIRGLGTEDLWPGRGWHAFVDPGGLPFCATENSPDQVGRRHLD